MTVEKIPKLIGNYFLNKKKYKETEKYFKEGAKGGKFSSKLNLALLYDENNRENLAFDLLNELAGEEDDITVNYMLGLYYKEGRGKATINLEESFKYFKKVVACGKKRGNKIGEDEKMYLGLAQWELAIYYCQEEQNTTEAIKLLKEAIKNLKAVKDDDCIKAEILLKKLYDKQKQQKFLDIPKTPEKTKRLRIPKRKSPSPSTPTTPTTPEAKELGSSPEVGRKMEITADQENPIPSYLDSQSLQHPFTTKTETPRSRETNVVDFKRHTYPDWLGFDLMTSTKPETKELGGTSDVGRERRIRVDQKKSMSTRPGQKNMRNPSPRKTGSTQSRKINVMDFKPREFPDKLVFNQINFFKPKKQAVSLPDLLSSRDKPTPGKLRGRERQAHIAEAEAQADEALSKEAKREIGRWGENCVFEKLKQHYEYKYCAKAKEIDNGFILEGQDDTGVPVTITLIWHNQKEETYGDLDLTLTKEKGGVSKIRYIEVKTTTANVARSVRFSENQWRAMLEHRKNYQIFRVLNAGQRKPMIKKWKNPLKDVLGNEYAAIKWVTELPDEHEATPGILYILQDNHNINVFAKNMPKPISLNELQGGELIKLFSSLDTADAREKSEKREITNAMVIREIETILHTKQSEYELEVDSMSLEI